MTKQEFRKHMEQGPLILDGATGSNLFKDGMPHGICSEKWIAEHPEPLKSQQRANEEAGSARNALRKALRSV